MSSDTLKAKAFKLSWVVDNWLRITDGHAVYLSDALEVVESLTSKLAQAREALERIAAYRQTIETKHQIVTGYEENMIDEAEEALAIVEATPEPQVDPRSARPSLAEIKGEPK